MSWGKVVLSMIFGSIGAVLPTMLYGWSIHFLLVTTVFAGISSIILQAIKASIEASATP